MNTQFLQEYVKHTLIRTPLERPLEKVRRIFNSSKIAKHPELIEIYTEPLWIEQMMQRVICDYCNCIDVGCHLGSTLSTIVSLAPQGNHIAFEPTPYKARWLRQKFPNVDIREVALGDTAGEVKFYHNANQSGFNGLRQHMSAADTVQELTVQCELLDNILPPDRRIDFVKLDVEGGELAVLRGATNMLRRYQPTLLFECTGSGLSSFGFTSAQIFDFLTKHSYSIFLLKQFLEDGEPLNFEQFDKSLQYPFQAFNFIALGKV